MNVHPRARQGRFGTAAAALKTGGVATGRAAETVLAARAAAVVALVAGAALAATAAAPAMPVARCQVEGPERRTAARRFVLRVLPAERILTRAEAASAKPTHHGEVIVRGALTPAARAASPSQTHVSIYVFDRGSGSAVWEPYPLRVRLRRANEPAPGRQLAVALVEGVAEGVCDRHYGTNLRLEARQRYTLTATLGRSTVVFSFVAGRAHPGHGG
jgi:hypothetical protein